MYLKVGDHNDINKYLWPKKNCLLWYFEVLKKKKSPRIKLQSRHTCLHSWSLLKSRNFKPTILIGLLVTPQSFEK